MSRPILSCFVSLLVLTEALSQVASVYPRKPIAGDSIVVSYDCSNPEAKLSTRDDVWIQVGLWLSDHTYDRIRQRMTPSGSGFRFVVALPSKSSFVGFRFVTPEHFDLKASFGSMVFEKTGKPARTANENDGSYIEELRLYPDNLPAYVEKWRSLAALIDDADSVRAIVRHDVVALQHRSHRDSLEKLYVLSMAYKRLGQREAQVEVLRKLVSSYPSDYLTIKALQEADIGLPGDISKLKWTLMSRRPEIGLIQPEAFNDLGLQSEVPLEQLEFLCKFWIQREPLNPFPYFHLAQAYHGRNTNCDTALQLIDRSISLMLQGMLRVHDDPAHKWEPIVFSSAYQIKAAICLQLGRLSDAYASLEIAQIRSAVTDPRLAMLAAQISIRLGMLDQAQTAYLQAIAQNWQPAVDSLRNLYLKRMGSLSGFENLLRADDSSGTAQSHRNPNAPIQYSVKTLDGHSFDSASLLGKVVVLNFWFKSCAPCIAELPSLNLLVEEFKSKDVVFLAINIQDSVSDIQSFLKKHLFAYGIVPTGQALATKFQVSVFPTHIIIDRKGQVVQKLVGGDAKRHLAFSPIIQRLLRE